MPGSWTRGLSLYGVHHLPGGNYGTSEAKLMRDTLKQNFMSDAGEVHWQRRLTLCSWAKVILLIRWWQSLVGSSQPIKAWPLLRAHNTELSQVSNRFWKNKLSLNCVESKVMCFGTHRWISKLPAMNIVHNDSKLQIVHEYKYLGVILDSCLTFKRKTDYIYKKVIKWLGILSQARRIVNSSTFLHSYKQLLPLMDYPDYIYDGLCQYSDCDCSMLHLDVYWAHLQ